MTLPDPTRWAKARDVRAAEISSEADQPRASTA